MGIFLNVSFLNVSDFPQRRALSVCVGWKDKGLFRAIRRCWNPHYLDASLLVFVEITLNRGAPDVLNNSIPLYKNLKKFRSVI